MTRTLLAVAIVGLFYAAGPVTAEATLFLPHERINAATPDHVLDVRWRRCWRDSWGRTRCRTCWRDRWGRVHCR